MCIYIVIDGKAVHQLWLNPKFPVKTRLYVSPHMVRMKADNPSSIPMQTWIALVRGLRKRETCGKGDRN